VGYIPIAECLPLYVAKEMGFFDRHGVKVELTPLQGGAPILRGIGADQFDVGFSNVVSLVLYRAEGHPYRSLFGGTFETERNQNHGIAIRVLNGKTPTAKDLRGKTIAINTRRNIEQLMLEKFLEPEGLKLGTDFQVQEVGFPDMLQQLEAKSIDAACLVEPFVAAAKALPTGSNIAMLGNHYLASQRGRTVVATYVASETAYSKRSEDLKRFADAMRDATAFIKENESRSRELLPRFTKMSQEQATKIGLSEFTDGIAADDLDPVIRDVERLGYLSGKPAPSASDLLFPSGK